MELLRSTFGGAKALFPRLVLPVVAVNLLVLLLILIGIAILAFAGIQVMGGTQAEIQSFLMNAQMGGFVADGKIWTLVGLGVVLVVLLFLVSFMGQIAQWNVLRAVDENEPVRPFSQLFHDSWGYMKQFVLLGLHMMWAVLWRILIVVGVLGLIGMIAAQFVPEEFVLSVEAGGLLGAILLVGLYLWVFPIFMWSPVFFMESEPKATLAIRETKRILKGNRKQAAFTFGVVFAAAIAVSMGLQSLAEANAGMSLNWVFPVLDALFSLVVVTPFVLGVLWVLTKTLKKLAQQPQS